MSVAERIHPNWASGIQRIKNVIARRSEDEYLTDHGDYLILQGWNIWKSQIPWTMTDRTGQQWVRIRIESEHNITGRSTHDEYVRVYAQKSDP